MLFCLNVHYILMIKRIFVPESCRRDLRTFSADFSGLKNSPRQSYHFLDVWLFQLESDGAMVTRALMMTEPFG